jgi:hypothetical protein
MRYKGKADDIVDLYVGCLAQHAYIHISTYTHVDTHTVCRWAAIVLRSKDEADDIVDLYGGSLALNHPKLFEQGLVHLCECCCPFMHTIVGHTIVYQCTLLMCAA